MGATGWPLRAMNWKRQWCGQPVPPPMFGLVLLCVTALTGCGREPKQEPIGLAVALSGPNQRAGEEIRRGAELALAEIADQTLIPGRKLVLLSNDTDSKPERAKALAVRLIQANKAIALIGGDPGPADQEMAWVCQNTPAPQTTPFLSAVSSSPRLTSLGPFVYRIGLGDDARGRALAEFAIDELKSQRFLVLGVPSDDKKEDVAENEALLQAILLAAKGRNKPARQLNIGPGDSKHETETVDWKHLDEFVGEKEKPDTIVLLGSAASVRRGVRSLRVTKLGRAKLLCAGEPELVATGNAEDLEGCYFCTAFSADDVEPAAQQFVKRYEAEHRAKPGAFAALGHDAAGILFEAVRRAESAKPDKIREQLSKISSFAGVSGAVSFDQNRNARRPAFMVQMTNGWPRILKKIPAGEK